MTGANPTCVGQVLRLNDEQRRAVERGHVLLASTMRRRTPVPPKPLTAILTDEELIEVVRANGIEKVIAALEAVMRAKVAA